MLDKHQKNESGNVIWVSQSKNLTLKVKLKMKIKIS